MKCVRCNNKVFEGFKTWWCLACDNRGLLIYQKEKYQILDIREWDKKH